ncbi:Mediator of RNA polymerase II transcription subunit 21 [Cytospora mali]|uniref:Mediator of RNA polymerase II transcription subunit 21 n=1 Tax=Cytospora mali TaxID=578113 RepID=A0A194VZB3_CYTMA|nr:Mediator of RNA polymerase II transcription subunit 21 [Valsa mali]
MGDRLTQLQDAVDQLAQQFVACIHFLHRYHDRETLGPNDKIREVKPEEDRKEILPIAPDEFKAGQQELARDLVLKEQQIEFIISSLPGLENNAEAQERSIRELEEELRTAEAQRQTAIREMNAVQEKLDQVIRGTKRP